jgi:PPM family protein phosphatase
LFQRSLNAVIHGAELANAATLKPANPHPTATAAAPASPLARTFAMLSHPGRVRHVNQDACAALPEIGAFVVCDGMGGAAAGEVASHLASEAFLHSLSLHPTRPPRRASSRSVPAIETAPARFPPHHPHTRLREAIRAANHAVFRHSRKSQSLHGMGTTLVAALWDDAAYAPTLWITHIGDSRCYRLRHGALQLLTADHSLVEEQVRAGLLDRVQAAVSPIRNIITRAIGSQPIVEPDIAAHETQSGDLYLLASDGLTRELDDADIAQILARASSPALEPACQALIDAANARGGRDNITVLLISCT